VVTSCFNVVAGAASRFRTSCAWPPTTSPDRLAQVEAGLSAGRVPQFVTGAITASGGSWNASIVAEYVTWGKTTLMPMAWAVYQEGHRRRRLPRHGPGHRRMLRFRIIVEPFLLGAACTCWPKTAVANWNRDHEPDRIERRAKSFRSADGAPRKVLDKVEFALAAGETLALLGQVRLRQMTLLRIIAGLIPPTRRARAIGSTNINGPASGIAMVFPVVCTVPLADGAAETLELGWKRRHGAGGA